MSSIEVLNTCSKLTRQLFAKVLLKIVIGVIVGSPQPTALALQTEFTSLVTTIKKNFQVLVISPMFLFILVLLAEDCISN